MILTWGTRCRVPTNTARSTANSKARCFNSPPITFGLSSLVRGAASIAQVVLLGAACGAQIRVSSALQRDFNRRFRPAIGWWTYERGRAASSASRPQLLSDDEPFITVALYRSFTAGVILPCASGFLTDRRGRPHHTGMACHEYPLIPEFELNRRIAHLQFPNEDP
jgi:hypothetical protein